MAKVEREIVQTDLQRLRSIERVAYGVSEAAEALGVGVTTFRYLLNSKQIRSFTVGKRRLVRKTDLQAYADKLFEEQNGLMS